MLINQNTAIETSKIVLVPYEKSHVPTYHEWMRDPAIQEATASEPLSLDEEYAMQASWRSDADKLTFVACLPSATQIGTEAYRMVGDVNLFLSISDEDPEGCTGELELMIASPTHRGKGLGRATILAFMNYIQRNLKGILEEFRRKEAQETMRLLQLKVKIGCKNVASVRLFEGLGFLRVGEGENYFGEVELVFEGLLEKGRMEMMLGRWGTEGYREVDYVEGE